MSDDKVSFVLDLDSKEFTETGLKAKGIIQSIGNSENLNGLLEGIAKTSIALGTVGLAAYAFKEAIDLTMEGEQLRRVEEQFNTLSAAAGISGRALKQGLEEAAKGLVGTSDLIQEANKFIVEMGSSAKKLPEIMTLATKATQVFGGDVKTNFDNMAQAIAAGNTRMLKHYGIVVDAEKAVQTYAKANGLAANELSETGRRQALLNAALESGEKNFAGISGEMTGVTGTMQTLKVTLNELKEIFILVFEKTIGPTLNKVLIGIKGGLDNVKTALQATLGDGLEKSNAQIKITTERIETLKKNISDLQANKGKDFIDFTPFNTGLNSYNIELAKQQKLLEELQLKNKALGQTEEEREKAAIAASAGKTENEKLNQQKHEANEIAFQGKLLGIRKTFLDLDAKNVQSFEDIDNNIKEQQITTLQQHLMKRREINNSSALNEKQQKVELLEEDKRFYAEKEQLERHNNLLREQLLNSWTMNSTTAAQGLSRAFKTEALKAQTDLTNFGKRGQQVFESFKGHSVNAFEAMGAAMAKGQNIGQAAADALKSIFLNMLADRAIAEGSILLLTGLWPPNPLSLGAGAGLIALGGALKSLAGGGGGASVPSGGGVSGGAAAPPAAGGTSDFQTQQLASVQQAQEQKTVGIHIAGNYFDTDSSRRQLMEIVRSESDATDFTYNKIGV